MDLAFVKVLGVFYFSLMILDEFSSYVLDWELMPNMRGVSLEDFVLRLRERYPDCEPKLTHFAKPMPPFRISLISIIVAGFILASAFFDWWICSPSRWRKYRCAVGGDRR